MKIDRLFQEGVDEHLAGNAGKASTKYQRVLQINPLHAGALHHLGLLCLDSGDIAQAALLIQRSLGSNPIQPDALSNFAYCLNSLGQSAQAADACRSALSLDPKNHGAWTNLGNAQRQMKLYADAQRSFRMASTLMPGNRRYLFNLALSHFELSEYSQARILFQECLLEERDDISIEALNCLAACCLKGNEAEASLRFLERALEADPNYCEAWNNRGLALTELGRQEEALASFDVSIASNPKYAPTWMNRGNALRDLGLHKDALENIKHAIDLEPTYADAWSSQGALLSDLGQFREAMVSHERAIELVADRADFWCNLGNAQSNLRDFNGATLSFNKALAIDPSHSISLKNLGIVLARCGRHHEAVSAFERAFNLDPTLDYLEGLLLHSRMHIASWEDYDVRLESLQKNIILGRRCVPPFAALGLFDSPEIQKLVAQGFLEGMRRQTLGFGRNSSNKGVGRIRVGYFSMDFREHPVTRLVVELIENHDREKFEIYGFSWGPEAPNDPIRDRVAKAFDRFLIIDDLGDEDVCRLSNDLGIDIAVDLGGHTDHSRPGMFLCGLAPIQVNFLGYPGTWGHSCMHYMVVDGVVAQDWDETSAVEKLIVMPDQFQVNSYVRDIPTVMGTDISPPLADDTFVFCCFNNLWKITPRQFALWGRILNEVPSSVLWLVAPNQVSARNLRAEASKLGLASERIRITPRVSREDYLFQYLHVDLFLDTLPFNAGTTASDALSCGVPIVTQIGNSFAGRMAASLLKSVGLPDLVAENDEEYVRISTGLARDKCRLQKIRTRLKNGQKESALFDPLRFARSLERALCGAYERCSAGAAPRHIKG
jgi:predicted O-linked N-acetylglucosamine transferase (SPINDLY family)